MKFKRFLITLLTTTFIFVVFLVPGLIFADIGGVTNTINEDTKPTTPFIPLVGIPGFEAKDAPVIQFGTYINTLYRLSISLAALLAVVKIVFAGAKYMLSDIVTHKEEAKSDIKGALVGLLIIIGAVLILNTVNTDITKNTIAISRTDTSTENTLDKTMSDFIARLQRAKDHCDSAKDGQVCVEQGGGPVDIPKETCEDTLQGRLVNGSSLSKTFGGQFQDTCTYLADASGTPIAYCKDSSAPDCKVLMCPGDSESGWPEDIPGKNLEGCAERCNYIGGQFKWTSLYTLWGCVVSDTLIKDDITAEAFKIKNKICTDKRPGAICEVKTCQDGSLFTTCAGTWCPNNMGPSALYDSNTNQCYINQVPTSLDIITTPGQTYNINHNELPSPIEILSTKIEFDSDHNYLGVKVKIISTGEEVYTSCSNINPSVCQI